MWVRQPLQKLIVPVEDAVFKTRISAVENLILSELNIKELELIPADSAFLDKKIKPNFLGDLNSAGSNVYSDWLAKVGSTGQDILDAYNSKK